MGKINSCLLLIVVIALFTSLPACDNNKIAGTSEKTQNASVYVVKDTTSTISSSEKTSSTSMKNTISSSAKENETSPSNVEPSSSVAKVDETTSASKDLLSENLLSNDFDIYYKDTLLNDKTSLEDLKAKLNINISNDVDTDDKIIDTICFLQEFFGESCK